MIVTIVMITTVAIVIKIVVLNVVLNVALNVVSNVVLKWRNSKVLISHFCYES